MSFGVKYTGGNLNQSGVWVSEPMPHIEDGFTLVFNAENWNLRNKLLRDIFATVGISFQPLIPEFCSSRPFERARRDWLSDVLQLLHVHGMTRIHLEVLDEVRHLVDTKTDF